MQPSTADAPELGAILRGDPCYGQLAGTRAGEELLVTVGSAHRQELAELTMPLTRCAEVTFLGTLDESSERRIALAERRPPGRPSSELSPAQRVPAVALELGLAVAAAFRELERHRLTFWGLPPSLVFHDPRAPTGGRGQVAIRYPLALPRLKRPCYGVMPMGGESFMPPELAGGGEWSRAASSWGLGALIVHWLLGRHPFAAENPLEHLTAIHQGEPDLAGLSPRLKEAVGSALSQRAERRRSPQLLLRALLEVAEGPHEPTGRVAVAGEVRAPLGEVACALRRGPFIVHDDGAEIEVEHLGWSLHLYPFEGLPGPRDADRLHVGGGGEVSLGEIHAILERVGALFDDAGVEFELEYQDREDSMRGGTVVPRR
jgi:hypothetical protein